MPDFPFAGNIYYAYSFATMNDKLYIFGGRKDGAATDLAVEYDGFGWKKIGTLLTKRGGHRSIVTGNVIMHIGGDHEQ